MMFRVALPVELERPGPDLNMAHKVRIDLTYEHGRWRGQCADPPTRTTVCDTLEEALVASCREISAEWSREIVSPT